MARITLDGGGSTWLPMCSDCGWRGLPAGNRDVARQQGIHHETRAHPNTHQARNAARTANKRRTRRDTP